MHERLELANERHERCLVVLEVEERRLVELEVEPASPTTSDVAIGERLQSPLGGLVRLERLPRAPLESEHDSERLVETRLLERLGIEHERASDDLLGLRVAPAEEVAASTERDREPRRIVAPIAHGRERRKPPADSQGRARAARAARQSSAPSTPSRAARARPANQLRVSLLKRVELARRGELLGSELADGLEHEVARLAAVRRRLANEALRRRPRGCPRDRPRRRPRSPTATRRRRRPRDDGRVGARRPRAGRSSRRSRPAACADARRRRAARRARRVAWRAARAAQRAAAPPRAQPQARLRAEGCRGARRARATTASVSRVDRRAGARARAWKSSTASRSDERLHRKDVLARDRQRLAARRDDEDVGAGADDRETSSRDGIDEVLAVVE